jgi:glucose-6-phosphate isomerase
MHERTATDAFKELVSGGIPEIRGLSYKVTRLSKEDARSMNGLKYCSVQVTFANGVEYGIEAFGEEGVELRKEAMSMKEMSERMPILIAA